MVTQLYLTEGGRMKSFSIFLCSLLMVACAGGLGGGWKGKHRDDLIKHYGSPVKETVLPGGGKELLYEEMEGFDVCNLTFVTDQQGVITSYSKSCG